MNAITLVDVEPDPVPIVLILAATLRRAARTPKLAHAIGHAKGNVALKSTVDPQAATMRFGDGGVMVVRGVSDDADVLIAADINTMADEHPPSPKVAGAARHPKLALTIGRLLDPPHGTWQEEAQRFLAFATKKPGVPRSMRVVCTDDGSELTIGDPPAVYELHGSRHALLNVFCGNTVLGQDLLDGKLFAAGKLAHLAELTGRSLAWMLGQE
ncbi:MAG TPA: hypothetical protein VFE86_19590 [Ilumatobacteraceae bacterium]|nr:hypothetical protein [Ilumatobacteraceae bacterium]